VSVFPSSPQFVAPETPDEISETPRILDENLVVQIMAQALIDQGYCYRDRSGLQVADFKHQLQLAVLGAMETHVVAGAKELAAKAVTKSELYAEVLPNGPGVTSLPESPEHEAARDGLQKKIWNFTNPGTSGYVQKSIATSGLVLCEAKVARHKIIEETGKREPTTDLGKFLTADHQLILTYYTQPAGAKFAAAARRLENQLGMVTTRQPELAGSVAKQMAAVVRQAIAALPHADVKQALALTAAALTAESNDEAASA
jgi:hypothetical protein